MHPQNVDKARERWSMFFSTATNLLRFEVFRLSRRTMGSKEDTMQKKCLEAGGKESYGEIISPNIQGIRKLDTGIRMQNPAKGAAYMKDGEVFPALSITPVGITSCDIFSTYAITLFVLFVEDL
jgi:hypothetical protein